MLGISLNLLLISGYVDSWPNRPLTDLRAHIGPPRAVPADCWLVWDNRRAAIRDFEKQAKESGQYNWTENYRIAT
jgi:hypothetical protein